MSQFLEVIEWFDRTGDTIVSRVPPEGSGEIKMGAQCIVRENQAAVFFRDGKALDSLGPGRHTLTTLNLPVLTKLLSLPFGFTSPFRAEVYFVNLKLFNNLKWGTMEPVLYRDKEFGPIRLRAFGSYTMRINDPLLFVNTMVGTEGVYSTDQVKDYLRSAIVARLVDLLGENLDTLLDLAAMYDELSAAAKVRVSDQFTKYGMELVDFFIQAITPPEDVQKALDERTSAGVFGGVRGDQMAQYMKYKAMTALESAAENPGGGAQGAMAGMGMGAGLGVGMAIPGMFQQGGGAGQNQNAAQTAGAAHGVRCPDCGTANPANAKFCSNCGVALRQAGPKCPSCGFDTPAGARFCPNCGNKMEVAPRCPECNAELSPEAKFCPNCGNKIGSSQESVQESGP